MKRLVNVLAVIFVIAVVLLATDSAWAQSLTKVFSDKGPNKGGIHDNFAAPFEKTMVDVECTDRFGAGPYRKFDDPSIDKRFCNTVANLPKNIVCDPNTPGLNTLSIHIRGESSVQTNNDQISLYFAGTNTFWSHSIETLPGAVGGLGHWNPGDETILTLDLCDLPDSGNVDPDYTTDAALEIDLHSSLLVHIQDDTSVDDMTLTLTALYIEFTYGAMDSFALPTDPASRSAGHEAFFNNPLFRAFDETGVNRRFGQTMGLLPLFIVGGDLEFSIRPEGELSCNDAVRLDELSNGLAAANPWSARIGYKDCDGKAVGTSLKQYGAPAQWEVPEPPLTAVLDLDDLPASGGGVTSVIPLMNTTNRVLDFALQDDTSIDYIKLRFLCSRRRPYFTADENIPTLSEWGMATLIALMAAAGMLIVLRRRRNVSTGPVV